MRIAVTGHRELRPFGLPLIKAALRDLLAPFAGETLVGVSCLADGADQLFAQAVLDAGGQLEVVLVPPEHRGFRDEMAFRRLLALAGRVRLITADMGRGEAWMAAAAELLKDADLLVAVWDGSPAAAVGSTADVVAAAEAAGVPVALVWPDGAVHG